MKRFLGSALCLLTLGASASCGQIATSNTDAGDMADAGLDAVPGTPDARQICGRLTFEDVLGIVEAATGVLTSPSPYTIGDVTFTGANNGLVFNSPDVPNTAPFFGSDHWGFGTGGAGAVIEFARPIESLTFRAGQGAVASQGTFSVAAGAGQLNTFITGSAGPMEIMITPPNPTARFTITFGGGSTDLLFIDDLTYRSPGCP